MSDQEFISVSSIDPRRRYDHFVKRVADWRWAWALEGDNGLCLQGDDEGGSYVAVWPHRRYAEACAIGGWAGAEPVAIEIRDWTEELPRLAEKGLMTVVFPTPEDKGFIVPPLEMKADIEAELSLYE